jgi:hypothetical protein
VSTTPSGSGRPGPTDELAAADSEIAGGPESPAFVATNTGEQQAMGFVRQVPDVADRVYAAGFFDGEGSVHFTKTNSGIGQLRVSICLTHLPTLEWFKERWGGPLKPLPRRNERWAPAWQWMLTARGALTFLHDIRPFVRLKHDQVEVGIAFQERIARTRKLPAERRELASMVARSRDLNRRGPRA